MVLIHKTLRTAMNLYDIRCIYFFITSSLRGKTLSLKIVNVFTRELRVVKMFKFCRWVGPGSPASTSKTTGMATHVDEFTLESVRDYMISRGGRVTNHELVKHFKVFLTNPTCKGKSEAKSTFK